MTVLSTQLRQIYQQQDSSWQLLPGDRTIRSPGKYEVIDAGDVTLGAIADENLSQEIQIVSRGIAFNLVATDPGENHDGTVAVANTWAIAANELWVGWGKKDGATTRVYQAPVASGGGGEDFILVTADNQQLEVGSSYNMNAHSVVLPTATEGDRITVWNSATTKSGDRYLINGDLRDGGTGVEVAQYPMPPGIAIEFVMKDARWQAATDNFLNSIEINALSEGVTLVSGPLYTVHSTKEDFLVKLSPVPAGEVRIKLTGHSTGSLRIEQADTGASQQIRYADTNGASVINSFYKIENGHRGYIVSISGQPGVNRWEVGNQYIGTELAPIQAWEQNTDYVTGNQVTAQAIDGNTYLYEAIADHNSGTTFNDAQWQLIGEAPINLPILEGITFTTQGYISSWTNTGNVVFIDGSGNDISSSDLQVISDTGNANPNGALLAGYNCSPPVNGTRSIKVGYIGASQKRGATGVRATYRGDAATTAITQVIINYFGNAPDSYTRNGSFQGTQTWTFPEAADFLTLASASGSVYEKLSDLPDPNTLFSGNQATVVNDGSNNGLYTVIGAFQSPGEGWIQC